MKNSKITMNIVTCLLAGFVAGCAGGSLVEANHGYSVQALVKGQIHDPAAAENPPREGVEGTDGQRMEGVMEAHRSQAGSAESVSKPIVINVD